MKELLLVIDVQNDFVNKHTAKILKKIEDLVNSKECEDIVFTRFINMKNSPFVKDLNYVGCMTKEGQKIAINTLDYTIIDKTGYTALNSELKKYLSENKIDKIYLCGFDTDACILKTALDLFENGYSVYVLENYCMSSNGKDTHNFSINLLKRLIGENKVLKE